MLRSRGQRALALLGLATVLVFAFAGTAAAHEQRDIGPYHVEVGWANEPTYAGFLNNATITITDANDQPVIDLGDTLKVEVKTGDQTLTLPVAPLFEPGGDGTQGEYGAAIIPNRPGTYSFHFTGTIGSTSVDETFTSSDTTFDDVGAANDIEFPAKDPSVADVAQKVDAVGSRVDAANATISNAQSEAKKAKDDASTTKTIAIIALVVGAVGVVLGGVSLARRRT